MSTLSCLFNSKYRKFYSSRLILCFETVLHRRFADRMRRRMEKNSPNTNHIAVREFGPIDTILDFDSEITAPESLSRRICVHVHLYYPFMAEEFSTILNRLTLNFVLLVSIPEEEDENIWRAFFKDRVVCAKDVIVKCTVNKGRDVLPWLVSFAEEIGKYELFCHMHTKRSRHDPALEGWREFLTRRIFGSSGIVNQILVLFEERKTLGLLFPPYFGPISPAMLPPNWGDNHTLAANLIERLSPGSVPKHCSDFPAGSFFWARVNCLMPLFGLGLTEDDFEEEEGQLDGTLAHAIERVIGALPDLTGMQKLCVTVNMTSVAETQTT
jgi:lipopolysaccharide biosynthesis protein